MADFPERVFADGERPDTERPLGELLSPLIVEADGTVVPVEYAFGRRWALGNARDNRLQVLASHWKRNRLADFRVLCGQVQRDATSPEQPAVINWYGRLAEASTGKLEATAAAV